MHKEEALFQLVNAFDQTKILAKAIALLDERDFVLLKDVKKALRYCIPHKVVAQAISVVRDQTEALKFDQLWGVIDSVADSCEL